MAGAATLAFVTGSRPSNGPKETKIDQRAVKLMEAVEAKMRAANTIEVVKGSTLRQGLVGQPSGFRVVKVQVRRPNKYRVENLELDSLARRNVYNTFRLSDGTRRLSERLEKGRYDPATKKYESFAEKDWKPVRTVESTADEDIYVWDDDLQTLAGLYVADDEHPGVGHDWRNHKLTESTFDSIRYVGKEEWKGKTYDVVEWGYRVGLHPIAQQVHYSQKIYVGSDTLVYRVVTTTSKGTVLEDDYRSIALNPALPDSLFAIPGEAAAREKYVPRWKYKEGDVLPDFTLPAHGALGKEINFNKAMSGKKGAVIWFWGYH
jgi:hypothetical protein